jgi:hypothetical protein
MTTILVLALIGTVISVIVGTLWYMPTTPTGKLHMKYLGFDALSKEEQNLIIERAKPTMWKTYLGQMVLSFLMSVSVVFVVVMSIQNGVPVAMALVFPLANWLCFTVPAVGGSILWGNCDRSIAWQKFFSDTGCTLVSVILTGLLAAWWVA